MKTKMLTLLAVAALMAGCSGEDEPADPPTSDKALTTSEATPVADPAPTTETPDDVSQTFEAPDLSDTTEASGPPELPPEAQEDSEAGARAYVEHYLNTFNYATMTPQEGLLDNLAEDSCEVCNSFVDIVGEYVSNNERTAGPILTFSEPSGTLSGDHAVIFVEAVQTVPARLDAVGTVIEEAGTPSSFSMSVRLSQTESGWTIYEIKAG